MDRKPGGRHPTRTLSVVWILLVGFVSVESQSGAISMRFSMVEGLPPGSFIGDIGLSSGLTSSDLDSVEFKLLQSPYRDYFTIDSSTWHLETGDAPLDRESLPCAHQDTCTIHLDLAEQRPGQPPNFISLEVTVQDVNDNDPIFYEPKLVLSMSENTRVGTPFLLPRAEDADSHVFGVSRYSLKANSGRTAKTFRLMVTNDDDGKLDLSLKLNRSLDREHTDKYTLQILAFDSGEPSRTGTMDVEVRVLDANDNIPTFDNATYTVYLPEDTMSSTSIIRVHATDPDDGANGLVTYGFARETSKDYGTVFHINNRTGEVMLIGPLDYEQIQVYNLLVTAQDQGQDALQARHARINVHVQDINDHRPEISINVLAESGRPEIMEDSARGEFVALVRANDKDAGRSGIVNCAIHDSNFLLVQRFGAEYKLETARVFDREEEATYIIVIDCLDSGLPPLRSTLEVPVTILDKNDNTPRFKTQNYTATLRENNEIGVPLLRVSATDLDAGNNSKLTYRILDDPDQMLRVSQDGVVSTNAKFDHEVVQHFGFRVVASDHGVPQLSSTATVMLSIIDVNDEPPVFTETIYNFGTFENQPAGTEICTITATDPDSPKYGDFLFSLDPLKSDTTNFRIDARSGKITTKSVLDREFQAAHYLVVVATDTAYPYPSSRVNVSVYVADKNDNAPQILFPVEGNRTVEVSSYAPTGHVFTRIRAVDADLGNNAALEYSIAKGNDMFLFEIDPSNGGLGVVENLQMTDVEEVSLFILVEDRGEPLHKSAVATLNVRINRTLVFARETLDYGSFDYSGEDISGTAEGREGVWGLSYHEQIIVILGAVTAVLVAILVTAIICVKVRQTRQSKEDYRYMCRVDMAQKLEQQARSTPEGLTVEHRVDHHSCSGESDTSQTELEKSGDTQNKSRKEVKFDLSKEAPTGQPNDWYTDGSWTHLTLKDLQSAEWHRDPGMHSPELSECGSQGELLPLPGVHTRRQQPQQPDQKQRQPTHHNFARVAPQPRPPSRQSSLPPSRGSSLPRKPPQPTIQIPNSLSRQGSVQLAPSIEDHQAEMHRLLELLKQDGIDSDSTSGCSADGSNTDSGRGPSEEGDHHGNGLLHPTQGGSRLPSRASAKPQCPLNAGVLINVPPRSSSLPGFQQQKQQQQQPQQQQQQPQQPQCDKESKCGCHGNSGNGQKCPGTITKQVPQRYPPGKAELSPRPSSGNKLTVNNVRSHHKGGPLNRSIDDTSDGTCTSDESSTSGSFIVNLGSQNSFKAVDV